MSTRAPWPWHDPDDRARCAGAVDDLAARGAFADLPAGAVAATHDLVARLTAGAADDGPCLDPPWASWALRLGAALGLGDRSAPCAVAVALSAAPADDARLLPAAARLGLAARALRAAGGSDAVGAWLPELGLRAPEGAPVNPPNGEREWGGAAAAGGRAPAALLGIAARLAGLDAAAWDRAAAALAPAVDLVRGAVRLWLDPEDADLRAARWAPPLRVVAQDAALGPALLQALAGDREPPARRHELRSLLALPTARALVADAGRELLGAARDGAPAALLPLVDGLAATLAFTVQVAAFHDLVAGSGPPPAAPPNDPRDPLAQARDAAAMALALLAEDDPLWRGSWEVRRWGLDGRPLHLVGRWFAVGLGLQALADVGRPEPARVAALLAEVPPGELRYFGTWDGVPPDADDLGLFLQLAATLPEPPRVLVESWLAVMEASAGADGVVPTWFHRRPDGGPTVAEGVRFGGDDCTAVRLCLLRGLVAWAPQRLARPIRANLARVLERWDGAAFRGCYYYDPSWAALQFARLAEALPDELAGADLAPALRAVRHALAAALRGAQRLDGGWGSPQRTAACAEALAASFPDVMVLRRALRYLAETQRPDGSWRAEPLFVTPGKTGHVTWHEGRELTTALCARALHACATAVAADGHPRPADPPGSW